MNEQSPAPDLWSTIDALCEWLDTNRPVEGREGLLLRILKLSEEVGEVAEAVIGATGQNPRKGVTHTWEDVEAELCDVAITALLALRTLTPEAPEVFARHLERVTRRSTARSAQADVPRQSL
ncbi:NTP pyrophosphatase, house-cleaning of non-canonical NTPs [Streptomyces sp. Ag82_O1-12]|uniref:MazG-like family protein n=1 Tax=unclassified Streptomyces TaxID=2593676 RepID=UPI000BD73E13|nr:MULTISPECIES: MazG-like family protein [unclassified Streptomyces]SMQ15883.1 NTP pyrophosphatase, house-cleaning of non-canonical NTPs [Streptomyces sp. Ag82_O1-12]SOD44911.1 NTP pyrophosphatase, house-cleaning of non-canonical NTPs [Streptomyces sp. Ag82_G6-1]